MTLMRDWLVNLPEELTESDLIDMVEGTLSASREPVAIAALKAEPRLGLLIKQIRMDKAALAGAHDDAPPESLADDVLSRIDARLLRALAAESQESSAGIPIHSMLVDEDSPANAVFESRLFRIAAVAAAGLLVAGVTAYVAHEMRTGRRPAGGSIASAPLLPPHGESASGASTTGERGADQGSELAPGSPVETAEAQPPKAIDTSTLALDVRSTPAPTADPAPQPPKVEPLPVAAAPVYEAPAPLSLPAAARFAREGRLALVVKPADVGALVKRLDALARIGSHAPTISRRELVWRALDAQSPPGAYSAVAALVSPSAGGSGAEPQPVDPTLATGGAGGGRLIDGVGVQSPALSASRSTIKALYSVQIEPSERGLNELARAIGEPGEAQMFRSLSTPIVEDISLEPESVLWWSAPTTRWIRPAVIPVIVEGRE